MCVYNHACVHTHVIMYLCIQSCMCIYNHVCTQLCICVGKLVIIVNSHSQIYLGLGLSCIGVSSPGILLQGLFVLIVV